MQWLRRLKLNAWFRIALFLVALNIAACGGGSSSSSSAPVPNANNGGGTLNNPGNTVDPRLPNLSRALAINLTDKTGYQGLIDIAKLVVTPIVGDALIHLTLPNDRTTEVSSTVIVAFEDRVGFWGAQLSSFPGTAFRTSSSLDIIYSDSQLSLRVLAAMTSADQVFGRIYYRVRQSGETQCQKVTVTYCPPGQTCTPPDTATPCRKYMELNNSSVKDLGSFSGKYSNFLQ